MGPSVGAQQAVRMASHAPDPVEDRHRSDAVRFAFSSARSDVRHGATNFRTVQDFAKELRASDGPHRSSGCIRGDKPPAAARIVIVAADMIVTGSAHATDAVSRGYKPSDNWSGIGTLTGWRWISAGGAGLLRIALLSPEVSHCAVPTLPEPLREPTALPLAG
jgi:hypothetical protein